MRKLVLSIFFIYMLTACGTTTQVKRVDSEDNKVPLVVGIIQPQYDPPGHWDPSFCFSPYTGQKLAIPYGIICN